MADNGSNGDRAFEISVRISPDYLSASVSVTLIDSLAKLQVSDIEAALLKKNVSYGLDKIAIAKLCENPVGEDMVVVARGTPFQHGEDGKVTYMFNTDVQSKPEIKDDGTVDFKNMNFLIPTKKGDVLARRSMPTMGTVGTLVTGKIMKGRDGKIVNFKMGKNVSLSEDGLKVIADVDGSIKYEHGVISVQKSLEIRGDVGLETGNISFSGKVRIFGNVLSGYSVVSTDDIIIDGLVEGARIETDGNLIINQGVQGADNAYLRVGGDLTAKFISSSVVDCKGSIEVDSITHSKVRSDKTIKAMGKRGMLIGGEIYAAKGIKARQLGSEMGTKTGIFTGITPEVLQKFQGIQDEKAEIASSIKKIDQVLHLLKHQPTNKADSADIMSKTLESREEYVKLMEEVEGRLSCCALCMEEMKASRIYAESVFPGVRVRLGTAFYSIKDRALDVMFVRENAEIQMRAWEDK